MSNETICNTCIHESVCRYKEAFGMASNIMRKRLEHEIYEEFGSEFGSEFADTVNAMVNLECREYDEDSDIPKPKYRAEAMPC